MRRPRFLLPVLLSGLLGLSGFFLVRLPEGSPAGKDKAISPLTMGKDKTPEPAKTPLHPFLAKHCQACHGDEKPKGGVRVKQLDADFSRLDIQETWQHVLKRIQTGEMPPKGKPRPEKKDLEAFTGWALAKLADAEKARAAEGRVVLRRLNRAEYENTVRDLLGFEADLQELLPQDTPAHGFDNIGEVLHVSSFLMERYLDAAEVALNTAIVNAPQPALLKKRYSLKDERHVKITKEPVFRHTEEGLIHFTSSLWHNIVMSQFYPRGRGRYRFRISAQGVQSAGKPVAFRVLAGPMLMGSKNHLVGYFDVSPDKTTVVEFTEALEARNTISLLPYGLATAHVLNKIGADKYDGPGLAFHWVEVEGPLHDTWPPPSHKNIFGDLPQAMVPAPNGYKHLEVISKTPEEDADRVLRSFARRAFRRPVTDKELQPYFKITRGRLAKGYSFEQAVRVGLKAVLVSPEFLFLKESPGKLDDFALANRLSYFLWSSMPDEELLALAAKGDLGQPKVLHAQAERLLKHPKARAFTENFVGQWLNLREIDATAPDFLLYPEFDELLKYSMVKETHLFFEEVLKNDLSLTHFVASDFTLLNERLARHYGIPGVEGQTFRKVKLPLDSHRGGVLTMASVLKVTANGTNTSPVVRGAWVLDRILGQPPAPPPPGVPAVEPDIRGSVTIRDQLARHRDDPSCASCHVKIDPPGFALESFDVIGGWRENYRSLGKGTPVEIDGRRMHYRKGPKVDPSDVLPDGRKFRDIDEFKKLLLADKDQIARALTRRLMIYGTGAPIRPGDHKEVEAIVEGLRERDFGLRSLVHAVVQSEIFRHK